MAEIVSWEPVDPDVDGAIEDDADETPEDRISDAELADAFKTLREDGHFAELWRTFPEWRGAELAEGPLAAGAQPPAGWDLDPEDPIGSE